MNEQRFLTYVERYLRRPEQQWGPLISTRPATQCIEGKDLKEGDGVWSTAHQIAWFSFDTFLADPSITRAVFLAGGPGFGKSRIAPAAKRLFSRVHDAVACSESNTSFSALQCEADQSILRIDSTLGADLEEIQSSLKKTLSAGKQTLIAYVHRPFSETLLSRIGEALDDSVSVRVESIVNLRYSSLKNFSHLAETMSVSGQSISFIVLDNSTSLDRIRLLVGKKANDFIQKLSHEYSEERREQELRQAYEVAEREISQRRRDGRSISTAVIEELISSRS